MPLSDNEQQILDEMEKSLSKTDPKLSKEVAEKTVYKHALGSLKLPIIGMIVGLAMIIGLLFVHPILSFIGFLVMFFSGLALSQKFKYMGMVGAQQISKNLKDISVNNPFGTEE